MLLLGLVVPNEFNLGVRVELTILEGLHQGKPAQLTLGGR